MNSRLRAVYEMACQYFSDGATADIGSDHGQLVIELAQTTSLRPLYATENKDGPLGILKQAVMNSRADIAVLKGDGLKPLLDKDIKNIIIAGMGGYLIADILKTELKSVQTFILQPNNHEPELRGYLAEHGYQIIAEKLVQDHRHIYEILVCQRGAMTLSAKERLFGPVLLKKKGGLFYQKWHRRKEIMQGILSGTKYQKMITWIIEEENEMYKSRREKTLAGMADHSLAIIHSDYPVSNHFVYLTGIARPNMALLLVKRNSEECQEILFIEKPDPLVEKWSGKRMTIAEAQKVSGIADVRYIADLDARVNYFMSRQGYNTIYFLLDEIGIRENHNLNTREALRYRDNYPTLDLRNLYPLTGTLRMAKDETEIANISKAVEITKHGLNHVLSTLHEGLYEYQVQAEFEYQIKYEGSVHPAFPTIAGAGMNGTMLHYGTNRDVIGKDELILLDLGATYEGYCADITRTYPASGHFTERQKQIYSIVLKANQRVSKEARPGLTLVDLNNICKEELAAGLIALGVISRPEELDKYYMHSVSHHLGMDCHDCTIGDNPVLTPGAVISDEPGLYLDEEGIGIRIEDDLLITEDGCRVLSQDIIREIDDIEAYMAKNNPYVK